MWCIYHIINFINNTVITVSRSININASTIVIPVISCGIITIGTYVPLIIVVILFIKQDRSGLSNDKYTIVYCEKVLENLYLMFCNRRMIRYISDIDFF